MPIYSDEYIKNGKKFDVLKIILSFLIICIHCTSAGWYRPLLRVAVPLFFLMTSYFFFHKQKQCLSIQDQKDSLKKYVKRTMTLYLFWFILLLPLTIVYRKWHVNFNVYMPLIIIRDFLFGSTFKGSWFLMACIVDIVTVWWLSKFMSFKWLFAIGIVFYSFCCLASNYHSLLIEDSAGKIYKIYQLLFHSPYNSFPAGFLFVAVGKYLSEKKILVSSKKLFFVLISSLMLLQLEALFIDYNRWAVSDDCFFSLIPLSIIIFMIIGQKEFLISYNTKPIRELSIILYCSHISIVPIVSLLVIQLGVEKHTAYYHTFLIFLTSLSCLLIGYAIFSLREKIAWLKNAY